MNTIISREALALLFALLLTSLFANAANNPAPRATVDRTVVSEGDSITLTIRVDSGGANDGPDYTPLQKDFEVYNTGSSSQSGYSGGHFFSSTEYQATLIPKRSGQVQIPPLSVAGSRTQSITIQVNPQSQTSAVDGSEPVFLEVQTDRNDVYVQQQILLTARVYIAVQLGNMQLTKPDFDNASIKQLSETTFNRAVNGTPYEVHEITYAIFPQQPGELTIPELVFNAVEITGSRSMFDFPGRGRALRKMSKQLTVHVKPIPKNFSGSVWLPARNLTLTENWGGDQQHLATGDSITRSITIHADGLLASQLPKLDEPQLDAAKIYPDQARLDDQQDSNGVHGKRVETAALIPIRAGQVQLPETRVAWWDIDSDSEKIATLPSVTLPIAAGASTTGAPLPPPKTTMQPTQPAANNSTLTPLASTTTRTMLWWQIASGVFALLWFITLLAYLQLRRQPRVPAVLDIEQASHAVTEQNAWRDFIAACHANNPAAARQKLLQWASIFYCNRHVHSIEQLQQAADNGQLTRELHLLDNRLFGALHDSGDWNGENLLRVMQEIKKGRLRSNKVDNAALPPLYPAA